MLREKVQGRERERESSNYELHILMLIGDSTKHREIESSKELCLLVI